MRASTTPCITISRHYEPNPERCAEALVRLLRAKPLEKQEPKTGEAHDAGDR